MKSPVKIYLDSNDYSDLSDPRRLTPELERIRDHLIELSQDSAVMFVYSSVSVCEMAPLQPEGSAMAERRAAILSRLCGRNALISFDRLIEGEHRQIREASEGLFEVISVTGDWFPEMKDFLKPIDMATKLRTTLASSDVGVNRKEKRVLQSSAFKRKFLNPHTVSALVGHPDSDQLRQLLEQYPMRPSDVSTLWDYVLGKVSKGRAEAAFLGSLRDPYWMMQWFQNHHEKLWPVIAWLRDPAVRAAVQIEDAAVKLRALFQYTGEKPSSFVNRQKEDFIQRLWTDVYEKVARASIHQPLPGEVERLSPGLNVAIRTLYEVFADSISAGREFKRNDFVDIVHASHAPYVDLYRADRYMAPRVSKAVRPYGTVVVNRLTDLPPAIHEVLEGRRSDRN